MNNCTVCGSSEKKLVFEPLQVFRCCSCGFHYRLMNVSSAVYEEMQKYEKAVEDKNLVKAREREATKRVSLIKNYIKPRGTILEIGVNDGTLLRKLMSEDFSVSGVEPNLKMVEIAREKNLDVSPGTLEENEERIDKEFDAVIMFHVLEHIDNPKVTLDLVHKFLNKDGVLILEVPGFDGPMFRARGWHANWVTEEHVSYFSMKTLNTILAQTGFKLIYAKRRNWDQDCETFRNDFLRLPLINLLYYSYRRIKEKYEPIFLRRLNTDWHPIEERIPQEGLGRLVVKLVDVLNCGDSLFVVAQRMEGLPPRKIRFDLTEIKTLVEITFMSVAALLLFPVVSRRKGRIKKILIVPTSKLGDFISQLPFLSAVRNKYAEAKISVLLFNSDLQGFIDPSFEQIIAPQGLSPFWQFLQTVKGILSRKFDAVYTLPWGARLDFLSCFSLIPRRFGIYSEDIPFFSRMIRYFFCREKVEYTRGAFSTSVYQKLANAENASLERRVRVKTEWTESMEGKIRHLDFKSSQLAGIIIGCGNKLKLFSSEKWARISDHLKRRGFEVCLIGSPADKALADDVIRHTESALIDTTGIFALTELAAFFERLSFVIGVDSGPLYLAHAVGVPVFDIAGPCDTGEQLPKENAIAIKPKVGCAPCSYVIGTERFCRFGTRRCLEDLTPDDVIKTIDKWLQSRQPGNAA